MRKLSPPTRGSIARELFQHLSRSLNWMYVNWYDKMSLLNTWISMTERKSKQSVARLGLVPEFDGWPTSRKRYASKHHGLSSQKKLGFDFDKRMRKLGPFMFIVLVKLFILNTVKTQVCENFLVHAASWERTVVTNEGDGRRTKWDFKKFFSVFS